MQTVNRIKPKGPVQAYKTWEIALPLDTHWQQVDCETYGCEVQKQGWVTVVDETSELGQRQAHYIRKKSGRPHREERGPMGTRFLFAPGTECFQTHRMRVDRPQIHIVRGGDWRGRVGESHTYDRPDQWQEDLATNLDNLRQ